MSRGGRRPGAGRKPGRRLPVWVTVVVTPDEKFRIQQEAKRAGLPVSPFCRVVLRAWLDSR